MLKNLKKGSCLFILITCFITGQCQDLYTANRASWLQKAAQYKPALIVTKKQPVRLVSIVKDEAAYQGYKATAAGPIDSLYQASFKTKSGVIIDFGEHITGHFTFLLAALKQTPDAPVRFKFTFGEVPSEVVTPFDPYPGGLSRAWLQDEVVTVMTVPDTVTIPRRLAFRYVKIELIAAPSYEFNITAMYCNAVTSAAGAPGLLSATASQLIKEIDQVGLNTLKECMQTVYEDGPKRDQRLWIGDLYLQSMANNYSFKQYDLTKRCLYLLAGLSSENGFLHSAVFERPEPHPQAGQFLLEYALLFNVALKDYLKATHDEATAIDLWPVAKKQLDIAHTYLQENGLMDFEKANKDWWIFFDWKDGLHKEVALQGITIFALNETYELAKMLGREKEMATVPAMVKKMRAAARTMMYDKRSGLFAGTLNKQISYASQIWMILSGVATKEEARGALMALDTATNVYYPGTPYLYHYYIQALINSGLTEKAKVALTNYWGDMISKGADTYWEAYDPENDYISPYNFFPVNSYCHAWSCTPVYFIRKYPEIFQR